MSFVHALEFAFLAAVAGGYAGFYFKSYLVNKAQALLQKATK